MRLRVICSGSAQMGLGHVIRARSFARSATRAGHETELVALVEPELAALLSDAPCATQCVGDNDALCSAAGSDGWDALVYDLTSLDRSVFEATARTALVTASLSPVFEHMEDVDACFTRSRGRWARGDAAAGESRVRYFAGLEYAVFSERCNPIEDPVFERALGLPELSIAVCMGGADAANKTLTVLRALGELETDCTVWVLLGEGYSHCYNALVSTTRGRMRHEVILAKTNRSMWRVMGNCALAVLAGGLTTIESLYAGLPSVNLFERPEHRDMVGELFALGACVDGGLISEASLATAVHAIGEMNRNRERLRAIRRAGRGLIDGRGGERVVRELERLVAERRRQRSEPLALA